jgi:cytoskeletal protein CcmA (bactofilin family)
MSAVKPALQTERNAIPLEPEHRSATLSSPAVGPRLVGQSHIRQFPRPRKDTSFQPRAPVIIGEASYRGVMPVDGIITGQLGVTGNTLTIKQRPKSGSSESGPELNGELSFKDMLRINGHVVGKIFSYKGTLIVDASARVEAEINVGVCVVSGTVVGDVTAHERVEVGSEAEVTGNISTPALSIKPGALFHGDCRMLKQENGDD